MISIKMFLPLSVHFDNNRFLGYASKARSSRVSIMCRTTMVEYCILTFEKWM
jgi:hypothetical protein